jgi:hypothetical protein
MYVCVWGLEIKFFQVLKRKKEKKIEKREYIIIILWISSAGLKCAISLLQHRVNQQPYVIQLDCSCKSLPVCKDMAMASIWSHLCLDIAFRASLVIPLVKIKLHSPLTLHAACAHCTLTFTLTHSSHCHWQCTQSFTLLRPGPCLGAASSTSCYHPPFSVSLPVIAYSCLLLCAWHTFLESHP